MEISRRGLIKIGVAQAAALALSRKAEAGIIFDDNPVRRPGPSILQGATDETRTQFSIVHTRTQQFRAEIVDSRGLVLAVDRQETKAFEDYPDVVTKVYVSRLALGESYTLRLVEQDTAVVIDERAFQTLDTRKADFNFAVCSCLDDRRARPEIWQDLSKKRPDVIFFIGDCVYCDRDDSERDANNCVTPRGLWQRFSEGRRTLEIYYSKELIPIMATWDDHDFGQNDGGANTYPYVKESQANFLQFFAQEPEYCETMSRGPGVASAYILGGQQILLLDDRSWRFAGRSPDRYAHWGREQEEWMLKRVTTFNGVTWLMNGSQIFPSMIFKESVSGKAPTQFTAVIAQLKQLGRKVFFVSGDVHFSEISQIEPEMLGYTTYEFTSSAIHSFKLPGLPELDRNPRRIYSTGESNYLLFKTQAEESGCQLTVESRSAGNQLNFTMNGAL